MGSGCGCGWEDGTGDGTGNGAGAGAGAGADAPFGPEGYPSMMCMAYTSLNKASRSIDSIEPQGLYTVTLSSQCCPHSCLRLVRLIAVRKVQLSSSALLTLSYLPLPYRQSH